MREENSNSQNVNYTITSCQRGTARGTYRIFLEDGSSFFISSDFFIKYKLKKGLTITEELFLRLEEESCFVQAYIKSLSLLNKQSYTVYKLKMKLITKDYDSSGIERAIDTLLDRGLLDDEKFAESWVTQRLRTKLDSYNTLLAGLIKKGVKTAIAKKVINKHYDADVEDNIIKKNVDKCCRAGKSSDKIIKALLRKGFNRNKVFYFVNNMGSFNEGD